MQKSLTKSAFKEADDVQAWRLNPAMFELYKSTSAVTDSKTRTSQKIVSSVITGVAMMCFIAFMVYQGFGSFTQMRYGNEKAQKDTNEQTTQASTSVLTVSSADMPNSMTPQTKEQLEQVANSRRVIIFNERLPHDYEIIRTEPMLQVRGVVQMGNSCKAYNAYGDLMTLTKDECKKYVGTGRVLNPDITSNYTVQQQITEAPQPQPQSQPQNQAFLINHGDKEPIFDMGASR